MTSHLQIAGIEAAQVIQNPANTVPLINGRSIYFRVYFNSTDIQINTIVRGTCRIKITQGGSEIIKNLHSLASARINHSDGLQSRLQWSGTLNFLLDDSYHDNSGIDIDKIATAEFELTGVERLINGTYTALNLIGMSGTKQKEFELNPATTMNLRVIGYHFYEDDSVEGYLPTETVIRESRKFIEACFPVSTFNFSTVTVDTPLQFKSVLNVDSYDPEAEEREDRLFTALFQHLLAIRTQDLAQHLADDLPLPDQDSLKTHYMGQIDDPAQLFGGAAMATAYDNPSTDLVALSEADESGQIQAHELAHLLGRAHPGIPDKAIHGQYLGQSIQDSTGATEINELGYISKNQSDLNQLTLGIDTTESATNPGLLRHNEYYDLMTYRVPQWVSEYTYAKLHERLVAIQDTNLEAKNKWFYWNVIGEYDLSNKTGIIRYVFPTGHSVLSPQGTTSRIQLKILHEQPGQSGQATPPTTIQVRSKDLDKTDTNPNLGVFQETIAIKSNNVLDALPKKIILKIDKYPVAVRRILAFADLLANNAGVQHDTGKQYWTLSSPTNPTDSGTGKFRLRYSLDQDAFFFDYNWSETSNSANDNVPGIQGFLQFVRKQGVAMVTTVQFKRNINLQTNIVSNTAVGGPDWQTALVSDRMSDSAWISPTLTTVLKGSEGDIAPKDPFTFFHTIDEISEFDCIKAQDLGIFFRVIVTVAGINLKVYEVGVPDTEFPFNDRIVLSADGSLGYKKLDFHKPVTADHTVPRQYYQPGLDPDRNDTCN